MEAYINIEEKTPEILNKAQKSISNNISIPFAFLFGSYAQGRETPLSDIDIAIYFNEMTEDEKIEIEHGLFLAFDQQVNILRLEDEDISPMVRLRALNGMAIVLNDKDFLNRFILSIIHRASEAERVLERLRKIA
ncbi:MAG: nucleotidyltransferase domain-containing protein [Candidatus Tectomicrobia bacterium]|uniref:Nucleotidyltransferase domain-containing protein n=1 Tax=Tectimicrobiota bacterium TaxID=2528274 RepID=A0A933LQ39_UNCTE|nr:nucleotidyltransferase domain-containing protein [Candidatus Tectomicrobia bacterium]